VRGVLALVAVLAAGCAGGGDDATRAEWAEEANAICRANADLPDGPATEGDDAADRAFLRDAIPIAREELADLRALDEPADDAARIEQMYAAIDEAIGALAEIADGGDAMVAGARARQAYDRANAIASELGLNVCAA
jgi:hypothetical protein